MNRWTFCLLALCFSLTGCPDGEPIEIADPNEKHSTTFKVSFDLQLSGLTTEDEAEDIQDRIEFLTEVKTALVDVDTQKVKVILATEEELGDVAAVLMKIKGRIPDQFPVTGAETHTEEGKSLTR